MEGRAGKYVADLLKPDIAYVVCIRREDRVMQARSESR
jgi:hypothetical protein